VIITDVNDYWHVKNGKCTACDRPLAVPYMVWMCANIDVFVCAVCCRVDGGNIAREMRGAATGRELQRMGFFEGAKQAAVSGGLLYTTGTNEKQ
jgi:hypothetical protein